MSPAEVDAFLAEEQTCRIATSSPDGPHVTALFFVWDGAALWFNSLVKSQRWTDVARDPLVAAQVRLHGYFIEQIEARRADPRDDMMTDLVQAEVKTAEGTRRLSTAEAANFANLLVSAGTESTARLLGWACELLAAHPDQRAELAAEPSLLANAVEETLRYEGPSAVQGRVTTRDIELHGTAIAAGSKVLLLTSSAGRDGRKYPDPDRFDIRRRFEGHVAFGHGPHFCIGAALARMEARIALEETLRRFPTWDIDHERVVHLHTSTVRGHEKIPISVGSSS